MRDREDNESDGITVRSSKQSPATPLTAEECGAARLPERLFDAVDFDVGSPDLGVPLSHGQQPWRAFRTMACRACLDSLSAPAVARRSGRMKAMPTFTRSDDLQGAEFVDANLRGARFCRADLSGVVMRGVQVEGADIDAP